MNKWYWPIRTAVAYAVVCGILTLAAGLRGANLTDSLAFGAVWALPVTAVYTVICLIVCWRSPK